MKEKMEGEKTRGKKIVKLSSSKLRRNQPATSPTRVFGV